MTIIPGIIFIEDPYLSSVNLVEETPAVPPFNVITSVFALLYPSPLNLIGLPMATSAGKVPKLEAVFVIGVIVKVLAPNCVIVASPAFTGTPDARVV